MELSGQNKLLCSLFLLFAIEFSTDNCDMLPIITAPPSLRSGIWSELKLNFHI